MSDSSQEDQQMARDWQLFLIMNEKIPEGQKIKKLIECLKNGANVSAVNNRGKTLLDIAIKKDYKHVIGFLQKRKDGDVNTKGDSSQSKDHPRFSNDESIVVKSKTVNNETKCKSANDDNSKNFLDRLEIFREGMSQHGVLFQLKLLMLVLWRATANQFSQFRLATELPEGEKFDDVVLQYRKDPSAKWKCRLLQAKHKENSEDKFSTKLKKIEGLFGCDDKAFSLQKYFRSYLKIKQKTVTPSPYSIFFQNEIEDVVIITNTDFNVEDRKYFEKVDSGLQTDEIFRLKDEENKFKNATVYKASMDSGILEKCKPIFENTSDYFTLIEILVDGIVKVETNRKNDHLLKEYYYPLTKCLLEIQRDSTKLRWKKDCPFIDSLVEEVAFVKLFDGKKIKMSADIRNKMFSDDLKESGKKSTENVQTLEKLAENVADAVKNEQELDGSLVTKFPKFIEEFLDVNNETLHPIFVHGNLKGNKLSDEMKQFRRTFIKCVMTEEQKQETKRKFEGKELKILGKFIPVDQPIIKEVSAFAEQMRKLIVENRDTKIIEINKKTPQSIRENLQMVSGFLIAEKFGKIRFCSTFLASEDLPESLQEFKEEFSKLLGQEFKEIYRYEFQMKGCDFKTCMDGALETELPVLHTDNDIIEFFGKLKFIVNFPNRVEIDDLMERNIREEFKIVDGKAYNSLYVEGMHNWMANSIGTFFTPDQANEMFKDISNNLSVWTVDGITKVYLAYVPKGFQFRDSDDFVELLGNKERVLIIPAQNLHLTRIRFVQTFLNLQQKDLKKFMKYTRGFGHIFLNLKQIRNDNFRSYVLNQIESSKELNLVVIECNEGEKNSELCEQFFGLINTKKKIKIVLIVPDNNLIVNLPKNFKQEFTDKSNFEDLDDRSKLKFLSEKITFQGQQTTLKDILENDKTGDVICPDILYRMIEEKDVSIGSTPPLSKGYQEIFYIERNIGTKVYVDLRIIKDEEYDTVVVDEYEEKFIEKCRKFPEKNVHWFKQEQIKLSSTTSAVLKWQKTKGSISNVLKYCVYEYELKESVEENDIVNDKNDIVVIADLAGMGKSTLLSSLTIKMKKKFPDRWLFRIDLNDCTSVLSEELATKKFNRNNLDWAKDLLKKMLACSPYTKLSTEQEEKLFLHSLSFTKKIFLLLDAVDEISPNYTEIIIDFILALRDFKVEKILITTRPNVAKKLEKELNLFSYTLETFSEHDQTTFLTKFWKKNFLENIENIDDRLNLYAKSLITKMSTLIDDEQRSFTGIPLQLMMMAEIFQNVDNEQKYEGCFQFLMSKETEPKLPDKLNIYDLYTMFVKEKYRIYSRDKKKDVSSNVSVEDDNEILHKAYQECHRTLALYAFFENDDLKKLLDSSEYEDYMKKRKHFIENIGNGKERSGIIDQVINNKPTFIHRTFMEYFVAEFAVAEILNHGNNEKRAEFMIESIFNNDDCTVIRSFINNLFLKKRLLKCEFYGSVMDSIRQREGYRVTHKLGYPRIEVYKMADILKIACKENNQEIVRFILNSLENYSSTKTVLFSNSNLTFVAKNFTILKIFVENDFDLCTADYYMDRTILHHACIEHSLDIIQWLLNQKCINVNVKDSFNVTPLHLTMSNESENSLEISKLLLEHEADVNARDKSGSQPLHEAASKGKINEAKYLLEHGADINCKTFSGWTLLQYAARSEQIEFCKWLINDHKINMNPRNEDGETPLYFAVKREQVEMTKLLLEHRADVNACDKKGFQPLHEAAWRGRIDLAKCLLEHGANINYKNCDGNTPLHCAIKSNQREFCRWLINDHKIEMNTRNRAGKTPLHFAVDWFQYDIIKLLVEHGTDINTRDESGFQPLHEAANEGRIDLAKYLIEHGADINCKSFDDSTLLHCAAESGRIEFCEWLLNHHKVEVNPRNDDGETPLHLAVQYRKTEIIKMLLENGGKMYSSRNYYVKFILESCPEVFSPLTFEIFEIIGGMWLYEEINWDGTVDLIQYLTSAAETLRNEREFLESFTILPLS